MSSFIFSADGALLVEKRTIRHACAICDDFSIAGVADFQDLQAGLMADRKDLCPVGTVAFCRAWMRAVGVPEPQPIDYPDVLQDALGRVVRHTTFGQVAEGSWVKPVHTKAWDAHVKQSDCEHPAEELVWESAVIAASDWLSEWRVYVIEGRIVGRGRYDDGRDDAPEPDWDLVQQWVDRYTQAGAPAGYALDVAAWPKGRTVLVEVTDGWALGYYKGTCSAPDYARLLDARWRELAGIAQDAQTQLHAR